MNSTAKTTGFIGLGQMGRSMARNILEKSGELQIYDAAPDAMAELLAAGARACESPADMAEICDQILLCLPYTPAVREVIFGQRGLVSGHDGRHELSIIDTTTLDRRDAIAIATELTAFNIGYSDSPVSGLPKRANDGTLTVMFGGTHEAFAEASDLLKQFGDSVTHCGPLGSGQAMKAINNIIYNINITALCEILPLATASGLDPQQLAAVVTSGSSRSFASSHFVEHMLDGKFTGDFALEDAYKDIVNVQQMAAEAKATTPLMDSMVATYEQALESGYHREAKSAMLKVYENALGVTFRR